MAGRNAHLLLLGRFEIWPDDDVYAAIALTTGFRFIARNGSRLTVAGGDQSIRRNPHRIDHVFLD